MEEREVRIWSGLRSQFPNLGRRVRRHSCQPWMVRLTGAHETGIEGVRKSERVSLGENAEKHAEVDCFIYGIGTVNQ